MNLDGGRSKVARASSQPADPSSRGILAYGIHESRTRNFLAEIERRGFTIAEFTARNPFRDVPAAISFVKLARQCDFVLTGTPFPWLLAWILLARLARRPCVVDCPMDLAAWPFPERAHVRWLVRLTLRAATLLLTIRSRQYMIAKYGLRKERVLFAESCPDERRVYDGLARPSRFQSAPGQFVICCSGGHEHHRLERFLPVFEALVPLIPYAVLLVIAAPSKPIVAASRKLAESSDFSARIHVLPVIKPVEDFYATVAHCDLWVASLGDDTPQGRHEFRMELLEMGLLRRAVAAAPTPGLIDNGLSDGQHLIYIQPSDPAGSASKIAAIAGDRHILSQLGANLEKHVKSHFSISETVNRLLKHPQLANRHSQTNFSAIDNSFDTPVGP